MNLLILSTYPIEQLMHGGQHRLANIVQAYRDAGFQVQLAGVASSPVYTASENFVAFPGSDKLQFDIDKSYLVDECLLGELFAENPDYFAQLEAKIQPIPDLIHVEQPWLFAFAKKFASLHPSKNISVLYGSQNIEHTMKFESAKSLLSSTDAQRVRDKVLACELLAVMQADAICCVSQEDQKWLTAQRGSTCILAPNGVRPRQETEAGIKAANEISQGKKFALYCGSAHPPNIKGFFDMFGQGMGCLAPDERLIIAGSAGIDIQNDARFLRAPNVRDQCIIANLVSEECLQGLLCTAHLIILPITDGGGTNLKTAEALWAGKHIVATQTAMRGFEQFSSAQGLTVANSPREFLRAIQVRMAQMPNRISDDEQQSRASVLWSHTLRDLTSAATTLAQKA
ncbi:glycosyltransferase [Undibacterium sp. Di24W]|uniref:glycosyltransferase n=1 Tax=Undibacterium sp. Di24W TaxID=3413033 RepID=UPI003BF25EBA